MYDEVEADIAIERMTKRCNLKSKDVTCVNGKIYSSYDLVKQGIFSERKIGEIDINLTDKCGEIKNLTESMYGFQKDELIEKAALAALIKLL